MSKILSFASWNVEHFYGKDERVQRVVDLLATKDPDVFAIYEVEGKKVYPALVNTMASHNFFLTENTRVNYMEILIGFRRELSIFVTQREEFRSKVPTLRPGALATVHVGNDTYSFLFLHLKSFDDPRSWGLRDDMFKHTAKLKRKLDKISGANGNAKFLCLGDLNTMGLNAAYNAKSDLSETEEIASLTRRMKAVKMRPLQKTFPLSWWNGSEKYAPGSQLDHVFADNELEFKKFSDGAEIEVNGWPEQASEADQLQWIERYSDHALLYGEIHS